MMDTLTSCEADTTRDSTRHVGPFTNVKGEASLFRGKFSCSVQLSGGRLGTLMKFAGIATALCALLLVSACARQDQNTYRYDEVGKTSAVSFGTVVAMRQVDIIGKNTGIGGLAGAGAGGAIGSQIGSGAGNTGAIVGGLVIGAVAGALAEQAMADRVGIEYTVTLESGVSLTVVQDMAKGAPMPGPGDRVMVQNTGGFQRVLPASHLPTEIKRPQGIKVVD